MSALEKHAKFFDRDNDGKIMPWDTYIGFRRLGYNILISLAAMIATHVTMSYSTQDRWIPDPLFSIVVKNIKRCKHGSDSGIYDHDGNLNEEKLNKIFQRYSNNGKMGFWELWNMTNERRNIFDIFGFIAAKLEWFTTLLLFTDKGYLTKEDARKILDGSIYDEIKAY